MSEEEDKRAKQLEEARKRVEELKKKSKKDKKKKKQNKEVESADESKAGSQDIPQEQSVEAETGDEEYSVEPSKPEEIPESQADDSAKQPVQETLEVNDQKSKSQSPSNDTSQLFSDDNDKEPDFMSTIQKQNEEEEIKRLKSELDAKSTECKTLKFVNMEQETTIEELEAEVKRLLEQVTIGQQELHNTTEKLKETEAKLASAEQSAANADAARLQLSQFNTRDSLPPQEDSIQRDVSRQIVNVDREALDRWHNWNVDMTAWRSIGAGPVVEF